VSRLRLNTGTAAVVLVTAGGMFAGCGTVPSTTSESPALYINEFMAQNDSTLADPDGGGGYPDWIEIYNAGTSRVDLGGMYLTDDLANPTKWRVPDGVVIAAGGYLIVWADSDPDQGSTHTSFGLSTEGEEIGLFNTVANGYAAIDTVTFGPQQSDVSYGRSPDGSGTWRTFSTPTPGQSNGSGQ
jgi:hypothetical protein